MVYIGSLLAETEPGSVERRAMHARIAEACRRRKRAQQYCLQVYEALHDPDTGEPMIPVRIDYSTARWIVTHGGGYKDLCVAEEEGWTLAQARAWSQGRARTVERRPRLGQHIRRTLGRRVWEHDGEVTPEQAQEVMQRVAEALRTWTPDA